MQILRFWRIVLAIALGGILMYLAFFRLPPRPRPTQLLENNWITSTLCSAPCWEALEPGATHYLDLQQRLAQNTRVTLRGPNELARQSVSTLPPNTVLLFARATGTDQGHLMFDYDARGAPSVLYEIALYPHPAMTLDETIGWFGYPSAYRFQQVNFETPQLYYLLLYYAQPRMEVRTSAIKVVNGRWDIIWSQPILQVSYLSPQAYASSAHGCWWRSLKVLSKECSLW